MTNKDTFKQIDSAFADILRAAEDYFNDDREFSSCDAFFQRIYHYCYLLDRHVNNDADPQGRRVLLRKADVLRRALSHHYPCFNKSFDRSKCDTCSHRFRCLTSRDRAEPLLGTLSESCLLEAKNMSRKYLVGDIISYGRFEKRKRELEEHLGMAFRSYHVGTGYVGR